jgi:CubicO group peptidase (beta-lactamase class C family)
MAPDGGLDGVCDGTVAPGFEPVRIAFDRALAERPGYGASLAIYHDGRLAVDLWGGSHRQDTLQLIWSCTKGAIGVTAGHLIKAGILDVDAPVASVWPEFAQGGKGSIPIRWVLSHQAGVPTIDSAVTLDDVVAGEPLLRGLERQTPLWEPGTAHGYHAITIGTLFGEIVRRLTGRTFGQYFADEVARPLGLDFWVGLPAEQEHRVAPGRVNEMSQTAVGSPEVIDARADPMSLHNRVFANPSLVPEEWNSRAVHAAEIPAANGICTARSLARMYAGTIMEVDGRRLLDDRTVALATRVRAQGMDVVNLELNRFGLAFGLPFPRLPFGGPHAFGHDGLGGGIGLADPDVSLALGFTTDLVPALTGADPAVWDVLEAARGCIGHA